MVKLLQTEDVVTKTGPVAQLGERQLCKLDVAGSIPVWSIVL